MLKPSRNQPRGDGHRRLGAFTALLALVAALLLPGVHGLGIHADEECAGDGLAAVAAHGEGGADAAAPHHEHGAPTEKHPRHDPSSCHICTLIEAIPVVAHTGGAGGQAWWLLERAAAPAPPPPMLGADRATSGLGARGPPAV